MNFECHVRVDDDLLKPLSNNKQISCCVKFMFHILHHSELYFPNLCCLIQISKCECSNSWYSMYVVKSQRLPRLQKIWLADQTPLVLIPQIDPAQGLTVLYLLERNKERLRSMAILYLCLRQITILDKGVIKIICNFVVGDDENLFLYHIRALGETLNDWNRKLVIFREALTYLKNDAKRMYSKCEERDVIQMKQQIRRVESERHELEFQISRYKNQMSWMNKKQKR